jgi:hypothetical protein
MATTAIYNFPDIMQGDTFKAQSFRVTIDNEAPSSALASVEIDFRANQPANCSTSLQLANGNGITITNAALWEFRIDRIAELDLEPAYYVFSIRTIAADGTRRNYLKGGMTVTLPTTRD